VLLPGGAQELGGNRGDDELATRECRDRVIGRAHAFRKAQAGLVAAILAVDEDFVDWLARAGEQCDVDPVGGQDLRDHGTHAPDPDHGGLVDHVLYLLHGRPTVGILRRRARCVCRGRLTGEQVAEMHRSGGTSTTWRASRNTRAARVTGRAKIALAAWVYACICTR
jgi:hypothetical protein